MIIQQNTSYDDQGQAVRFILHDWRDFSKLTPITQSYAFIFNKEGKILIGKNPKSTKDSWSIPGGTLEEGESPDQALERELLEEVDAVCSRYEVIAIQECLFPGNPKANEGEHYYQLRYAGLLGELKEQTPDPDSGKVWERKFVDVKELPDHIYWGTQARVIAELAWEEIQKWLDEER